VESLSSQNYGNNSRQVLNDLLSEKLNQFFWGALIMKNGRSELMGPLARRLGLAVFLVSVFATIVTSGLYLHAELKRDLKILIHSLMRWAECILPGIGARLWLSNAEGLVSLGPVIEGDSITAGNASQLPDGAAAFVLMEAKAAEQGGLESPGIYCGMGATGLFEMAC